MNIVFEDDGQIRAGHIMSEAPASAQVELPGGRRIKVKSSHIFSRFEQPEPAALLAAAQEKLGEIDMGLLWESATAEGEFSFEALAREYFGSGAGIVETTATLMALQQSPMYFYKKTRGHYKRAPEEALKAALASIERKAREAEQIEGWVQALLAHQAPPEISEHWARLLYAPDKQSLAYKALTTAADRARMAPTHLLARAGAIPSTHALHYQRFLLTSFPRGTGFPATLADAAPSPEALAALPLAEVAAFSIDDQATTEIDDAFSLQALPDGGFRLGIHIAAPALGITPGSALDQVARDRLSTVYMPGNKITMLPEALIADYSLDAGKTPPALSLYTTFDAALQIKARETRLERITVADNLRLHVLDALEWMDSGRDEQGTLRQAPQLRLLHRLANELQRRREAPAPETPAPTPVVPRVDYNFAVHGDPDSPEARIDISVRQRGSPIDVLVSELMIFANVHWGQLLAERGWPGMFRVQAAGRTRMSAQPDPHEGLNVPQYLWATSPLRRYADLVNQRQLLALIAGQEPPYTRGDAQLLAAVSDFDTTYALYAEFQQQMEFYWCLRYIEQEGLQKLTARVLRENLVRFDRLPIVQRIHELPALPQGAQVVLGVAEIDYHEPALHLRYIETVTAS